MPDLVTLRRALISVSDKTGVVDFARALASMGVELISTGGTARLLADAGLTVTPVETVTGMPEMMDGRVKTLHPKVHGGILAVRSHPEHAAAMARHGIAGIDLVCVNLYPFERTVARPGVTLEEAVENIDIGGPAMVRSAAKNFDWVAVVTRPEDYRSVLAELDAHRGATTLALRARLSADAFARTAEYDAAIAAHLAAAAHADERAGWAARLGMPGARPAPLRYGENPHQRARLLADERYRGPSIALAPQLHGKELSYNNINDGSAALALAQELARLGQPAGHAAAAVVKHANPCGACVAPTAADAVRLALAGDPVAAYGGILAVSREVDAPAAELLCAPGAFLEVIIAPGYTADALEMLKARWANVRLLVTGPWEGRSPEPGELTVRSVPGGVLVQERDLALPDVAAWQHRAGPPAAPQRLRDAAAVWVIVKHLASNAVALGGPDDHTPAGAGVRLFGAGAGQMDRVTACRLAVEKAGPRARGAIAASDAFFPFDDGPRILADAGVSMIVHPGGSKRDDDTFKLCEDRGIACYTTGIRHFRH
ncbi:MAG: bifunctional phosphoribosylaminoimidazolecarboxamide formyltransferase/IMP cyclohydrolase [Phycisphaerales bacterium]|nr:bifunctional phosphoribosylaminoimidazolecarboxamide formyltransferase/IMP cyclohydrolase [Phycisphaerales bacterium]